MFYIIAIFNYEGNTVSREYYSIDKIIYETPSGKQEVSGEQILTYAFPLKRTLYLQGENANYVIDTSKLVSLEISKSN